MSIVLASSMFVGVTTWGYRVGRSSGLPPGRVLVLSAWLLSELHRAPDVRLHGSTLGSSDPSRARSTVGPDRSHWLRAKMMLFDPALTSTVLRELIRAVSSWLRQRARRQSVMGAVKTGAVTVIQRFSSALGANPHFHTLFLDGSIHFPSAKRPCCSIRRPPPPTKTSRASRPPCSVGWGAASRIASRASSDVSWTARRCWWGWPKPRSGGGGRDGSALRPAHRSRARRARGPRRLRHGTPVRRGRGVQFAGGDANRRARSRGA